MDTKQQKNAKTSFYIMRFCNHQITSIPLLLKLSSMEYKRRVFLKIFYDTNFNKKFRYIHLSDNNIVQLISILKIDPS